MALHKNSREVPIPARALVNKKTRRVYVYNDDSVPRKEAKAFTIGWATSDSMMQYNDNYILLFPEEYGRYVGSTSSVSPRSYILKAGMYSLALSAGYSTGVYPCLCNCFGPVYANGIMDLCMYAILMRSNVAMPYETAMRDQVLFSGCLRSDSWFSKMFQDENINGQTERFKQQWLDLWSKYCGTEVWLAVDGSNSDCAVQDSELAAHGHSKSHNSRPVVAYMYAIDVKTYMPLTWDVYTGSVPDCKGFATIKARLEGCGIKIKGVLLDRGFCCREVITAVESELKCDWVVMTTSGTNAHKEMMLRHAQEIRWRADKALAPGIFGTVDKVKLFGNDKEESFAGLYFDGANGSARSVNLMDKIFAAEEAAEEAVLCGEIPTLEKSVSKYLSLQWVDGKWVVKRNYDAWQCDIDEKGYGCIASNREMDAGTLHYLYHSRDASETLYPFIGSRTGGGETRVHYDVSIRGKHLIIFVANIIRGALINASSEKVRSKRLITASKTIGELNQVEMLFVEGIYTMSRYPNTRCKLALGRLGLNDEGLRSIATSITSRELTGKRMSEVHAIPPYDSDDCKSTPEGVRPRGRWAAKLWADKKKRELVEQGTTPEEADRVVKKLQAERKKEGKGETAGNGPEKNQKVPDKDRSISDQGLREESGLHSGEQAQSTENAAVTPKRGRGRPKGSLNKKPAKARMAQDGPKRKPGRPKGSKNKKTIEREKEEAKRAKRRARYNHNKDGQAGEER